MTESYGSTAIQSREKVRVPFVFRATAALVRRVSEHLAADRESRGSAAPVECRLDLSEGSRSLLRHLREQKLASLAHEAQQLLDRLARVTQEREDLERALAATPDEADI